eukprot:CAMPEP_0194204560 /NCGR_PEP_ID=MMETSP0156-20130528/4047_1 /TAXON_ID=33649 /ORGANISM="Thalassionema nitzschioides, Strain L26-B" /LENGTH=96 /DNA_ID=CAMNT_0038930605 /DNA_START=224 /DNA_END=511 /DNA_ORIENTATION=-
MRIEDATVKVRMDVDYKVQKDYSCDSECMLSAMDRVGDGVRKAHSWVPMTSQIYLVMDNAGGHGTDEAVEECKNELKDKHDIEILYQIPRSPCCNL